MHFLFALRFTFIDLFLYGMAVGTAQKLNYTFWQFMFVILFMALLSELIIQIYRTYTGYRS